MCQYVIVNDLNQNVEDHLKIETHGYFNHFLYHSSLLGTCLFLTYTRWVKVMKSPEELGKMFYTKDIGIYELFNDHL